MSRGRRRAPLKSRHAPPGPGRSAPVRSTPSLTPCTPSPAGRPRWAGGALAAILGLAALLPTAAQADPEARVAIQGQAYQMAHELRLAAGVMPLNAFEKSWTASLSYTLHFSNAWAWEMFQVTAAGYQAPTDLRDELVDVFGVPIEDFAPPKFMVTTGVELTPLYGKMSFFNRTNQHHAMLAGIYGGVVLGDRDDLQETLKDIRPTFGLGLGYRWYWSKVWSMRADIRDYVSFRTKKRTNEKDEMENIMLITISISANLGRDDA